EDFPCVVLSAILGQPARQFHRHVRRKKTHVRLHELAVDQFEEEMIGASEELFERQRFFGDRGHGRPRGMWPSRHRLQYTPSRQIREVTESLALESPFAPRKSVSSRRACDIIVERVS